MKMSVLQWNVWYQEKADNILKFISETDADILCLQELTRQSAVNPGRDLVEEIVALGYHAHYEQTLDLKGPEHRQMGNGIFSKLPLEQTRTVYVQQETTDPDRLDKEARAYLEADIQVKNQVFTVATAHLSYTHSFEFSPHKDAETEHLLKVIGHSRQNYILTGDFNALPESRLATSLDKLLKSAGPSYDDNTWSTKPFAIYDFSVKGLEHRLDYVYTSSDIEVLSSKILQTDYSDHLPILCEIAI